MALLKISQNNTIPVLGFTLMEVLLVLAMLSIIASSTMIFSMSMYQSALLHAERSSMVTLLQTARAYAMQNKFGMAAGVAIDPVGFEGYVLFNGNDFVTSDVTSRVLVQHLTNVTVLPGAPTQIIFSQLSGESNYDGEVVLQDTSRGNARTSITINYAGAIY